MSHTDITPFQYGDHAVRTLLIDGEPWFVLADLTRVLGLKQFRTDRLSDDLIQNHPILDSLGRTQQATVVSEAGMYEVVLRSDKPEAVAFRRWITTEVLPAIRKTGSYGQAELTGPQLMAKALIEANVTMQQLTAQLASAKPKADTWDMLCSGAGDYTITDAAKVLARAGIATGPRKLHAQMQNLGWIYQNQRGKWTATQARVNDGCLAERARYYVDDDGVSTLATPQVRVTAKGLDKLKSALSPRELAVA